MLKPGGRIAIASWTPEGTSAASSRTIGRHAPPPPGDSPLLWGTEAHVCARCSATALRFERGAVRFHVRVHPRPPPSFYFVNFGPIVAARHVRRDEAALLDDLAPSSATTGAGDGYDGEYLTVAGAS